MPQRVTGRRLSSPSNQQQDDRWRYNDAECLQAAAHAYQLEVGREFDAEVGDLVYRRFAVPLTEHPTLHAAGHLLWGTDLGRLSLLGVRTFFDRVVTLVGQCLALVTSLWVNHVSNQMLNPEHGFMIATIMFLVLFFVFSLLSYMLDVVAQKFSEAFGGNASLIPLRFR